MRESTRRYRRKTWPKTAFFGSHCAETSTPPARNESGAGQVPPVRLPVSLTLGPRPDTSVLSYSDGPISHKPCAPGLQLGGPCTRLESRNRPDNIMPPPKCYPSPSASDPMRTPALEAPPFLDRTALPLQRRWSSRSRSCREVRVPAERHGIPPGLFPHRSPSTPGRVGGCQ